MLDHNKDGLVEFHETVFGFDVMCNGSVLQKLKLFYYIHLEEEDRARGKISLIYTSQSLRCLSRE